MLRYALDQRNTEDEAFPDEVAGSRVRFVDSVLGEVFAGGNSDGLEGTNTVDPNTVRNVLFGSNSEGDIQYGLQHHDTLYGMGGADQLHGGSGNDRLEGGFDSAADYLNGGEDYDTYVVDVGDTFEDPDDAGSIFFRNTRLTFSEAKQVEQNGNRYENSDGMVFILEGSTLKVFLPPDIQGSRAASGSQPGAGAPDFTIASFENGSFGIRLKDKPQEPDAPPPGNPAEASSPIVLDLNGDGVLSTTNILSSRVYFDVDANGRAERTAWVSAQDGLLVRDLNLDGRITSGMELFGTGTRSASGGTTPNGFVALSWLDGNGDNKIDAGDAAWRELQVWKDLNQNGYSDSNELFTLGALGIASISTIFTVQNGVTDPQGNRVPYAGSFALQGGAQRIASDIYFQTTPGDTRSIHYKSISEDIASLPNINGVGNLLSLHQSMQFNELLENLVTQFVSASDPANRRSLAEEIMLEWAGIPRNKGKLNFEYLLEQEDFYGEVHGFDYKGRMGVHATSMLVAIYDYWRDKVFADLMRQTHLKSVFDLIEYSINPLSNVPEGDLSSVIAYIDNLLVADRPAGLKRLSEFAETFRAANMQRTHNFDEFRLHYLNADQDVAIAFAAAGATAVTGAGADNSYHMLTGNYFVQDSGGNDIIYKYEQGNTVVVLGDGDNRLYAGNRQKFHPGALTETTVFVGDGDNILDLPDSLIFLEAGNGNNNLNLRGGISDIVFGDGDNFIEMGPPGDGANTSLGNTHRIHAGDGDNRFNSTHSGIFEISTGAGIDYFSFLSGSTISISAGAGADSYISELSNGSLDTGAGNDIAGIHGGTMLVTLGDGDDEAALYDATVTLSAGAGDDEISITGGTHEIDLGTGNDFVDLFSGVVDFHFVLGDGVDDYILRSYAAEHSYTFSFGAGITLADLSIATQNNKFIVSYGLLGDKLVFDSELIQPGQPGTYRFAFADGGVTSLSTLLANKLMTAFGSSSSDNLEYSTFPRAVFLSGLEGTDNITGTAFADTLSGGSGLDALSGGAGNDTYLFNVGDGQDSIYETGGTDKIVFAAGIAPEDVLLGRRDAHIELTILATGERLVVDNWFTSTANRVESVEFANSVVWNTAAIQAAAYVGTSGNDTLYGTTGANMLIGLEGNDTLYADSGNDSLDGGTGNDLLDGAGGNDTYIFKRGYGRDSISESAGTDVIQFGNDIAPADVVVGRNNTDLLLTVSGTSDLLTIPNWFSADSYRVETVSFQDGTSWLKATLNATLNFVGTDGVDTLTGTTGNDIFNNSTGNDTYYGNEGADTYHFGRGDGRDNIQDTIANTTHTDRILLRIDLTPSDVGLVRNGTTMFLHILDTADRLQIGSQFSSAGMGIEEIVFANGTVWGATQFNAAASTAINGTSSAETLDGTLGDDTVYAGSGNDTVNGAGGIDTLYGEIGNDILSGGSGNDLLYGGAGNDTYKFGRGDGHDSITEESGTDKIELAADILPADVSLGRLGSDLFVRINDTLETIKVLGWFDTTAQRVDTINFANATVWSGTTLTAAPYLGGTGNDLLDGNASANIMLGLGGNDTISGYGGNDTLDGGAGNDVLDGGDGNDIYKFGRTYGNDTVQEYSTSTGDKILFGAGIVAADIFMSRDESNLYLQIIDTGEKLTMQNWFAATANRIERVDFADASFWATTALAAAKHYLNGSSANQTLYGITGADVIDGGAGNDIIYGGTGNDTYLFGPGSGNDTISEYDTTAGNIDTVQLASGLLPADVSLYRDANNAYLRILATGETLTLESWYYGVDYRTEQIVFSNGTVWNSTAILAAHFQLTDDNDNLVGSANADVIRVNGGADTVNAGGGNDTVYGGADDDTLHGEAGNDLLYGEDGNDNMTGGAGTDTLSGGAGIDLLEGGDSNDKYLFGRDHGEDHITETATGGTDRVVFDSTVVPADILLGRFENHLVARIAGTEDAVVIKDRFLQSNVLVENFEFADATLWTVSSKPLNGHIIGLASWDNLQGTTSADVILAGAGNDVGSGNDGDDILYGESGDDNLYGGTGNDHLHGGSGNDYLLGEDGNDVYHFGLGDGVDTISDVAINGGQDKVVFGAGITTAMLTGTAEGTSLAISIQGSTDKLLVAGWHSSIEGRIERFEFADGTEWLPGLIQGNTYTGTSLNDYYLGTHGDDMIAGGEGDDELIGWSGDDVLDGGTGKDFLQGDAGNDLVIFGVGYGLDTFFDDSTGNIISFKEGITPASVQVLRSDLDLILVLAGGTDALKILNGWGSAGATVTEVRFADSTIWNAAYLIASAQEGVNPFYSGQTGTAGDDNLVGNDNSEVIDGFEGNDVLVGAGGINTLRGGAGNDTYYVSSARDKVIDSSGHDTLHSKDSFELPENIEDIYLLGNANLEATGNNLNNLITGNSGANRLLGMNGDDTLTGGAGDDSLWGGAGTDALFGQGGDDLLFGGDGNDTLDGGAGRDLLYGGKGDDDYAFGALSGHDIIVEIDTAGSTADAIVVDSTWVPGDIELLKMGDDLVLLADAYDASLTIRNFYLGAAHQVEFAEFSNNVVWDLVQIAPTGGGSALPAMSMAAAENEFQTPGMESSIMLVGSQWQGSEF